jgi:O-antigen/teichoic acid export membrane protein
MRTTSFLGSGVVYASTMAAQRAVTFLLLPIFTRVFAPAQYGRLSIALSANAVAVVVFAFGMELAIFRNVVHLADDPRARNRFISSTWTFLIIAPLVVAMIVTALMAPLLWSNPVVSVEELGLSMLAASLYVAATTLPLALLRADRRLRDFVIVNGVATAATAGLTVILVIVLRAGETGWLLALNIGSAITLFTAMVIVPYRRPEPFDRAIVRDTLRRSLPVMPHFLALWSLQLADRLLLVALVTTAAVGIYSLASSMALPLLVLTTGINQAFMPVYAQAGKSNSIASLRSLIELQVAIVLILSQACALLAPVAINVFLDVRYRPAAHLTAWIVLGYAFIGLYSIPMNGVTLAHGRSRRLWVVSLPAAFVNLGLIYIFVPQSGLVAAAIASAAGYGALLVGVWLYSQRTDSTLSYPWRTICALLAVSGLAYAGAALTVNTTRLMDLVVRLVWITATATLLLIIVKREWLTRVRSGLGWRGLRYDDT